MKLLCADAAGIRTTKISAPSRVKVLRAHFSVPNFSGWFGSCFDRLPAVCMDFIVDSPREVEWAGGLRQRTGRGVHYTRAGNRNDSIADVRVQGTNSHGLESF